MTIDRVMEEIRALSSEERLRLVNRIVETLLPNAPQSPENGATYRDLRGKYRNTMRPSDAFARNKEEERQLEDRSL